MAGETYTHGVVVSITGCGELTSFSEEGSVTQITAIGHLGHTVAEDVIDPKKTYNIEALYTGTEPPEEGDLITIGAYTARVLTSKITEEGAGYKKNSITANRFVTNSLPAAGS